MRPAVGRKISLSHADLRQTFTFLLTMFYCMMMTMMTMMMIMMIMMI